MDRLEEVAMKAIEEERYEDALTHFEHLLYLDSSNPQFHYWHAFCSEMGEDLDSALVGYHE